MEIQIFSEPKSSPFPGFRYHLAFFVNGKEFFGLVSNYVFDDWGDALTAAVEDYRDFIRD